MTQHPELKTIGDFIRYATTQFHKANLFYGHGTDNAWDDATQLVLYILNLPHEMGIGVLNTHLIETERETCFELIQKRIEKRIPVAYLTHEAWFAGLSFYVDERVLIPRSPLAELIENQFQPWLDTEKIHRVLDLCTGSGCIAIACAKALPDAQVEASDISHRALAVAQINVARHRLENKVKLHQSDLFKTLAPAQYDLIISNPPYVSQQEMLELPEEYRHEPSTGLKAGEKGLDLVTTILVQAKKYLKPTGTLIVEVGDSEHALVENFPHLPFTWLSFERGGGGVFILTAEELNKAEELNSSY